MSVFKFSGLAVPALIIAVAEKSWTRCPLNYYYNYHYYYSYTIPLKLKSIKKVEAVLPEGRVWG